MTATVATTSSEPGEPEPLGGSPGPVDVPAAAAVVARGVRRAFGDRHVLAGIDLTLERGEFVALLGRSGSGKSTLLRALAGLDPGVEGEVIVPTVRAVVFQDPRLLPWATVLDNVTLGLQGRRADARAAGEAALAEVGLAGHEADWPKTLSGGEAQRAALARALVREPALLLLDEPFGALDALTRIRMHALVHQLHSRHHPAVLLVTHDVDEAVILADRVLVLTDGLISLDLPVEIEGDRHRGDQRVLALRQRLLAELGVDDHVPTSFVPATTHPPADPEAPCAGTGPPETSGSGTTGPPSTPWSATSPTGG